jgi:hypothetical protein
MAKSSNRKVSRGRSKKSKSGDDTWSKSTAVLRATSTAPQFTLHKFIQNTGILYSLTGLAGGQILGANYFALSQVPNYGNLTALYDDFQVDKVEVKFILRGNPGSGLALPRINVYPDFDDATAPPTIGNVFNHPRVQQHVFTQTSPMFKLTIEPRVAIPAYQGAFTAYTVAPSKTWIDCTNAGVQHYGLKYAMENFYDTNQIVDVYYKFFLTMRNPL